MNFGLLRGIADFAIETETGFRILLPNIVFEASNSSKEELAKLKNTMPAEGFDGVIHSYDEESDVSIEEFYRNSVPIGDLAVGHRGLDGQVAVVAHNSQGELVELPNSGDTYEEESTRRVRFLQLLAKNDAGATHLLLS